MAENWSHISTIPVRRFVCGHCGLCVGTDKGFFFANQKSGRFIYPCPHCERPTYFEGDKQVPGVAYGKPVQHLPADLDEIYTEARNCMQVVLLCRLESST